MGSGLSKQFLYMNTGGLKFQECEVTFIGVSRIKLLEFVGITVESNYPTKLPMKTPVLCLDIQ